MICVGYFLTFAANIGEKKKSVQFCKQRGGLELRQGRLALPTLSVPSSLTGDLKTRGLARPEAPVASVLQQAGGKMQNRLFAGASLSFLLLDKPCVECSRYISAEVWKIIPAGSLCQLLAKMPYLLHVSFCLL